MDSLCILGNYTTLFAITSGIFLLFSFLEGYMDRYKFEKIVFFCIVKYNYQAMT